MNNGTEKLNLLTLLVKWEARGSEISVEFSLVTGAWPLADPLMFSRVTPIQKFGNSHQLLD